jgi:uncharacterized YigZ family protein
MLFSDSYLTVSNTSQSIFRDRGSKFLAFVFPVKTEEEIKIHLSELKKEHPQANHHCYAWRLGADKQRYRTNDDGEPAGTAGKPIYSQILSKDLTNILIVVVRYFGGTLLGVSGLIAAYKAAATEALTHTRIEEQFICFRYTIQFSVNDTSDVMRLLKQLDCKIEQQAYTTENSITFTIKKQYETHLLEGQKKLFKTSLKLEGMA